MSLYKKVSKSNCRNFRGIYLLSIVGKLFSRIILNRLVRTIVNGILPESQCGFRASRGTGYDFQCSAIAGEVQRTESSIEPMFHWLIKGF